MASSFLAPAGGVKLKSAARRRAGLPVANVHRELRGLVDALAGDHIAAGVGFVALRDPDLPVGVLGAEGEMIALLSADHAAAEILHVGDVGHQRIVDIRLQQVGTRKLPVELVPQLVDQLVDRAGHFGLDIGVLALAEERQCLPVKDHLGIGEPDWRVVRILSGRLSTTVPEVASWSFCLSLVTTSKIES